MMNAEQIMKRIIDILRGYVNDAELLDEATFQTQILRDLRVNSARIVDIIIKCEDIFKISIDDDEADQIATIGDIVSLIQEKTGVKPAGLSAGE